MTGAFENFPYTNFHELNMDWIINTVKKFKDDYTGIETALNTAISNIETALNTAISNIETKSEQEQSAIETKSEQEQTAIENKSDEEREAISELAEEYIQIIRSLGTLGKRIIIIGDSYGNRVSSSNLNYFQTLRAIMGFTSENSFFSNISGGAFAHSQTDHTFLYLLQNLTVTNPETITDIYVQCGANDASKTYENNLNALIAFSEYAKIHFPIAKLHIFACGMTMTEAEIYKRRVNFLMACREASAYGWDYVQNSDSVLFNTLYLESDKCHPNQYGVTWIAWRLASAITSGYCTNCYELNSSQTSDSTITVEGATVSSTHITNIQMVLENNILNIFSDSSGPMATFSLSTSLPKFGFSNYIHIPLTNSLACSGRANGTTARQVFTAYLVDTIQELFVPLHAELHTNSNGVIELLFRPRTEVTVPSGSHIFQIFMHASCLVG